MHYVMNSKKGDYRVLPWHPGLDENTDYIRISEEDAKAVMSKQKTGAQVIKEIFLRNRSEEIESVKASPVPVVVPVPAVPPVPAAPVAPAVPAGDPLPETPPVPVLPVTAPADGAGDLPPSEPPLDFSNMTVTGLHTLKVGDLRTFAREKFDLSFRPGTTKDAMIDLLTEKMDEAK